MNEAPSAEIIEHHNKVLETVSQQIMHTNSQNNQLNEQDLLNVVQTITDPNMAKQYQMNKKEIQLPIPNKSNPQSKVNTRNIQINQQPIKQIEQHQCEEPKQKIVAENNANLSIEPLKQIIQSKYFIKQMNDIQHSKPAPLQNQSTIFEAQPNKSIQDNCEKPASLQKLEEQQIIKSNANELDQKFGQKKKTMSIEAKPQTSKQLSLLDQRVESHLMIVYELIVKILDGQKSQAKQQTSHSQSLFNQQEESLLLIVYQLIVKFLDEQTLSEQKPQLQQAKTISKCQKTQKQKDTQLTIKSMQKIIKEEHIIQQVKKHETVLKTEQHAMPIVDKNHIQKIYRIETQNCQAQAIQNDKISQHKSIKNLEQQEQSNLQKNKSIEKDKKTSNEIDKVQQNKTIQVIQKQKENQNKQYHKQQEKLIQKNVILQKQASQKHEMQNKAIQKCQQQQHLNLQAPKNEPILFPQQNQNLVLDKFENSQNQKEEGIAVKIEKNNIITQNQKNRSKSQLPPLQQKNQLKQLSRLQQRSSSKKLSLLNHKEQQIQLIDHTENSAQKLVIQEKIKQGQQIHHQDQSFKTQTIPQDTNKLKSNIQFVQLQQLNKLIEPQIKQQQHKTFSKTIFLPKEPIQKQQQQQKPINNSLVQKDTKQYKKQDQTTANKQDVVSLTIVFKQSSIVKRQVSNQQQPIIYMKNIQKQQQYFTPLHQSAAYETNIIQKEVKQQKLKIKMQTESLQSANEEKGQLQKRIVQFTEFAPSQKPKDQNKNSLEVQKQRQIKVKTEGRLQPKEEIKESTWQKEIDFSFRPQQEIQKKKVKTIEVMQDQLTAKGSPSKQSGKISKRTLYEKKVHQIVKQLSKHDEKKVLLPTLDESRKGKKRSIDLSKLDSHIGLTSNVMNFTMGEVTGLQDEQNAEKLLSQIESLKGKLSQLQKRKQQRDNLEKSSLDKDLEIPVGTIASIKGAKKQCTGRIYKKLQPGQSRISEQVQTFHSQKKANYFGIEPTTLQSAPRQRLTSTLGFQTLKQLNPDLDGDNSKTVNIHFRVRKPSKSNQGLSDFDALQKESGISGNTFQEKVEEDKCFQTSRRQDGYQKIQFTQQEMLPSIEKPSPRKLEFQPNFRQNVEKYFLEIGSDSPRRQMGQSQLINLAKQTFHKFGVSLHSQRSSALNIKKYKNCISFILDTNRTILWYYEGKFYFGGWNLNKIGEGEKNQWGYEFVPGKYIYSGSFRENKRDGYGIIKFISREQDTIYEGEWANGFKQGIGKQIEPDGVQYVGDWLQGRKHGYGTIRISDQQYFSGNFISGVKNGEGNQVFKNGDTYVGHYRDGKFDGKGTYTWANHSKYSGNFIEGARNGNGIWVANHLDEKSDRYQGQYKNDKKNGFGVYQWKDGTIYEGQFLNDLKHGEGTVSYGDGRKATLQWYQGSVVPKVSESGKGIKRVNRGSSQKSESLKGQKSGKAGSETKPKGTRISIGRQQI